MNQLIAYVRRRQKPRLFKLLSDREIYDYPFHSVNYVEYDSDHNLDDDSWFRINSFSEKDYCIDFLKKDFVSSEYNDIPKDLFSKIAYICSIQDDLYYFQKINPSLVATRKTLKLGDKVELEEDSRRLFLNTYPDAVYIKNEDALVFRNLATISSIFKGIDELFKQATDNEVQDFINESFIEPKNGYTSGDISKPNRKRIALAQNTLKKMSQEDRDSMFFYIKSYCGSELSFDEQNKKVEINNNEELKYLVYGIEQRFYTTELSNEKRLANSVISLQQ